MWDGWMRQAAARRLAPHWAIALGVAVALAAAALRTSLYSVLKDQAEFIPNFLALFLAAYLGGWVSGLTTLLLSGIISFYVFFYPPLSLQRPAGDVLSLALFWLIGGLILWSLTALRRTLWTLIEREAALLAAEEQERRVAREMGHRIKNLLAVVRALVGQTLARSQNTAEARARIEARLDSLAIAQDLVLGAVGEMQLAELVRRVARSLADERLELDLHADAEITAATARALALALHELATNAIKYGALAADAGRVQLGLEPAANGGVSLTWRESGGPPVEAPTRQGMGTKLITHALGGSGRVRLDYAPAGLECRFELPAEAA